MPQNPHPIKTIDSQIAWSCKWYHVRHDTIQLPDGNQGEYNIVELRDSVFVVPVTQDGQIVLIRNYRYTLKQWVWEIPAGSIEDGQSVEDAVYTELREEIGGYSDRLQFLMKASTMNGIGHNHAHIYIAHDVTLSNPEHEPAEVMTAHPMPVDDVYALIHRGEMNDATSMTALLLAQPYLKAY